MAFCELKIIAPAPVLDLFTYVELSAEWHVWHDTFNLQYCQYIINARVDKNVLSCSQSANLPEHPENFELRDQSRHSYMALLGAPVIGFETDRETFLGPYRGYSNPLAVERGNCTGSCANHGNNPCGVLQTSLQLQPGESREIAVLLGVGRADREGPQAMRDMGTLSRNRRRLVRSTTALALKDCVPSRLPHSGC